MASSIVSLTLILLKELSRVSAHASHLHSLQCKTAPVPRMVLLWLWLSEQQCKRSRDFLARWDLPDTMLTFGSVVWESSRHFATPHPAEKMSEEQAQNSLLMTCRYPELGSASDWLKPFLNQPVLGSDTSSVWNFCACLSDIISRETSAGVAKCRLFSQAKVFPLSSKTNIFRFQHNLRGSATTVL